MQAPHTHATGAPTPAMSDGSQQASVRLHTRDEAGTSAGGGSSTAAVVRAGSSGKQHAARPPQAASGSSSTVSTRRTTAYHSSPRAAEDLSGTVEMTFNEIRGQTDVFSLTGSTAATGTPRAVDGSTPTASSRAQASGAGSSSVYVATAMHADYREMHARDSCAQPCAVAVTAHPAKGD